MVCNQIVLQCVSQYLTKKMAVNINIFPNWKTTKILYHMSFNCYKKMELSNQTQFVGKSLNYIHTTQKTVQYFGNS